MYIYIDIYIWTWAMRWTMLIMDDGLGLCDGPQALDFIQRV